MHDGAFLWSNILVHAAIMLCQGGGGTTWIRTENVRDRGERSHPSRAHAARWPWLPDRVENGQRGPYHRERRR